MKLSKNTQRTRPKGRGGARPGAGRKQRHLRIELAPEVIHTLTVLAREQGITAEQFVEEHISRWAEADDTRRRARKAELAQLVEE